ncbi:class I SAM-dependent methyltransferase [Actinopolymorpha pittospori]
MTTQLEHAPCLLCGQTSDQPVFDGALRSCAACGFTWSAGLDRTRTDLFDGSSYTNYFARAEQWRHEARKRLRWLLSVTEPVNLLEAGCAGGFFVEAAREAGIAADGVELSPECVKFAREQLHMPVRLGTFESKTPATPVGAVCAFHVLEHVDDPRAFLEAARRFLIPGGWLALEVPNIESAGARREGTAWPGLQPEHHRWHFSPRSLPRLVEAAGFVVHRCDTVLARYYSRLPTRMRPAGVRAFVEDVRSCGTPLTRHRLLGDHLRLLARVCEAGR